MTYLNIENILLLMELLVAAISVLFVAILVVPYLYKTADSRKIRRIIRKYSAAFQHDVVFPDGIGGYFFIDYLVLLPGRILALNLPKVDGYVFGGENIELWTQVVNNKTTKFKNPLEQVKLFAKHAADQLKFDGIIARVLFDSKSEFPKGVPEGVLLLANFKDSMTAWAGETPVSEATKTAWDRLSGLVAEGRERYNTETGRSRGSR